MTKSIVQYAGIALVVVMIAALAGWYFFLRGEREGIAAVDLGRGAGIAAPFGIDVGSTYENIVSSFSTLVGGIVQSGEQKLARLAQVGKTPAAGYGFIGQEGETRLRFVERGSGYVFDASPETGALERTTNTLIPRTYEALVAGNSIVLRGLDESGMATTILGEVPMSTSTTKESTALKQRRLGEGIRAIALDQKGDSLFYIAESPAGGAGILSSWDGKTEKQLFASAIAGWQIIMLEKGQVILTQNADDELPGYAYRIDGADLAPVVGNVAGLMLLPHPNGSAYLYSEAAGETLSLYARMSPTTSPVLLPVRTIAEKCAWAPQDLIAYCAVPQQTPPLGFVGKWYKGEVHTADAWWKIDIRGNAAEPLYAASNAILDVEGPRLDPSGSYIAFRNAADKTLWILRVAE